MGLEDVGDNGDGFESYRPEESDKGRGTYYKDYPLPTDAWNAAQVGVGELENIDDEIYLIAFGDHCEVTASREGFTVEEYDHD